MTIDEIKPFSDKIYVELKFGYSSGYWRLVSEVWSILYLELEIQFESSESSFVPLVNCQTLPPRLTSVTQFISNES